MTTEKSITIRHIKCSGTAFDFIRNPWVARTNPLKISIETRPLFPTWNDDIILGAEGINVAGVFDGGLDLQREGIDHARANLVFHATVTFLLGKCYKS